DRSGSECRRYPPSTLRQKRDMDCMTDRADGTRAASILDWSRTLEYESRPNDYALSKRDLPALRIPAPVACSCSSSAPRTRRLPAHALTTLRCNATRSQTD